MNRKLDSNPELHSCVSTAAVRPRVSGKGLSVQIKRFVVVGVLNTAVDLTVLNTLIFLSHMGRNGIWFSFFKAISFLVAVLNSYIINHSWTFEGSPGKKSVAQAGQFLMVSLFGAVINVGGASYVATYISPPLDIVKYWPSIAALAGTACGLIFNFLGYKHIVFATPRILADRTPSTPPLPRSPLPMDVQMPD